MIRAKARASVANTRFPGSADRGCPRRGGPEPDAGVWAPGIRPLPAGWRTRVGGLGAARPSFRCAPTPRRDGPTGMGYQVSRHDPAANSGPGPDRRLLPGQRCRMRLRSVEPTMRRTRLVQRLSKPPKCLGLDRGLDQGHRSRCRVNKAGPMTAIDPPGGLLTSSLASKRRSTHAPTPSCGKSHTPIGKQRIPCGSGNMQIHFQWAGETGEALRWQGCIAVGPAEVLDRFVIVEACSQLIVCRFKDRQPNALPNRHFPYRHPQNPGSRASPNSAGAAARETTRTVAGVAASLKL